MKYVSGDVIQVPGFESVLFNVALFKTIFPLENILVIDARCFWYNTVGTTPVNIAATLWKGGLPTKSDLYGKIQQR